MFTFGAGYPQNLEEGVSLPFRCREWSLGPLEEQQPLNPWAVSSPSALN